MTAFWCRCGENSSEIFLRFQEIGSTYGLGGDQEFTNVLTSCLTKSGLPRSIHQQEWLARPGRSTANPFLFPSLFPDHCS